VVLGRGFKMKFKKINLNKKPTYIKFAENVNFLKLFKKINQEFDTCFLLESLGPENYLSRYSIIGFSPKHLISAKKNNLIINKNKYQVKNPYLALKQIMPQNIISRAYAGGLVGYLGFDAINYFEPSLQIKLNKYFDQFLFGFYTDGLVLDKITGEIFYFYYDKNRLKTIEKIHKTKKIPSQKTNLKIKLIGDTLNKKKYTQIVKKVKQQICSGNTFQCVIGFKTEYQIDGDPLLIYQKLRQINPSPHMYYLKFGKQKIIGASPELLFRLSQGEMETYPLAGTIGRGKNVKEDQKLARKLLNDKKEIAEHNMLVDLHRNDLGKVAQLGTVKIQQLKNIKRFSHVQHIESTISGQIAKAENMFSALAANFPAGTLSGAPKIESIKIINKLEPSGRGPYGGAIGHFGFNGDCTFAIPIRSLFISGNYAFTQSGSGIVYDSMAKKEYAEIKKKAKAIEKVLKIFNH